MSSTQTHCYKSLRQTENTSHKLSTLWNRDGGICKTHIHIAHINRQSTHTYMDTNTHIHTLTHTDNRNDSMETPLKNP